LIKTEKKMRDKIWLRKKYGFEPSQHNANNGNSLRIRNF